jgi:hypothetical protein
MEMLNEKPWGPEFKSQLGQDRFVGGLFEQMDGAPRFFIDIGAGHPIDINNTHYLEKKLNWNGLSIDMGPENPHCHLPGRADTTKEEYIKMWKDERSTTLVCEDALQTDYKKLFEENNVPKVVDYLSVDLEPSSITLECLYKLPFDEYQFKIITFEHDYYRSPIENDKILTSARQFLSKYKLEPVLLDRAFAMAGYNINKIIVQDDWYVNKDFWGFCSG